MKTTNENVGEILRPTLPTPKNLVKKGMIKNEILVRDLVIWKPKAIIFCAGFGMTSEGLKQAGYDVIGVIDISSDTEVIYKANFFGVKYLRASLRDINAEMIVEYFGVKPGELAFIQISNPCTGVSSLTQCSAFSEVNDLFFVATTLAFNIHALVGCPIVCYENVEGALDNKVFFGMVISYIKQNAPNHFVAAKILNGYVHGDPQARDRVFIQVVLKTLGQPVWAEPISQSQRKHIEDIIPEAKYIVSRNYGKRPYYPNQAAPTITGHPDIEVNLGGENYRKLYPIEAAQFMGLCKGFILFGAINKQLLGIGNGVCVSVMRRLAECIKEELLRIKSPEELLAVETARIETAFVDVIDAVGLAEELVNESDKGYVVYQGKSMINQQNIVAIITMQSNNSKTGNMPQLWILNADIPPLEAAKTGADESICGDCSLKKSNTGVCYVNVGLAPTSVWKAWKKGLYPKIPANGYNTFSGLSIRFGAYGDPVAVPLAILNEIKKHANNYTSYTHQWRVASIDMQTISMASVESAEEYNDAVGMGWRTFRIIKPGEALLKHEIMCPNVTSGVQCIDCRLCSGTSTTAKNIAIPVHGSSKSNFYKSSDLTLTPIEVNSEPIENAVPVNSTNHDRPKIISAKQLMAMHFESLPFQAEWLEFLGEPAANFHAVVFGLPGSGKSTFSVQLASYLANTFGPALYVSGEEGFSLTFRKKFESVDINNIDVADIRNYEEMCSEINHSHYKFLVIDSLNTMKIDAVQLRAIKEKFKEAGIITISQSTKDGNFRGSNEIVHDGDIAIQVQKGLATTIKNRFHEPYLTYDVFNN